MNRTEEIREKIEKLNAAHGYEAFALPGTGWPAGRVLVLNRAGVVQRTLSFAVFFREVEKLRLSDCKEEG